VKRLARDEAVPPSFDRRWELEEDLGHFTGAVRGIPLPA